MSVFGRRRRGTTLVEVAVVIVVIGVLVGSLYSIGGDAFRHVKWFRQEAFDAKISEAMSAYIRANPAQFVHTGARPASVPFPQIAPYVTGAGRTDGKDPEGRVWRYVRCGLVGQVFPPPTAITTCIFLGYASDTPVEFNEPFRQEDWETRLSEEGGEVEDYLANHAYLPVAEAIADTREKLERVRINLENYYRALYRVSADKGIGINRFAKQSAASHPLMFDSDSDLRNTEVEEDDDHRFTVTELEALGLSKADVTTVFGEVLFDNGSSGIRSPDNGHTLPYTTRLWVEIVPGHNIEAIASSQI